MTSLFEDHLARDAVVAYVDGELSLVAFQRAAAHISRCDSCAAEVAEQASARQALRRAAPPVMPSGLLDALRSIPVALPGPESAPVRPVLGVAEPSRSLLARAFRLGQIPLRSHRP